MSRRIAGEEEAQIEVLLGTMPFKYDRGAVDGGQSVAYMVSDLNYIVVRLLLLLFCLVLCAVATFCILNALG